MEKAMTPELRKQIDRCIELCPAGRPEELADALVEMFNVTKDDAKAWKNAKASALKHVKARLDERAAEKEGGPLRLGGGEGEIIDVLPPPSRPVGDVVADYIFGTEDEYRAAKAELPGFYKRQQSDESQAISDFIEQRARENENLPPEKPEVTIRALLNDLIEANLL